MSELEQIRKRLEIVEQEIAALKSRHHRSDAMPGWEHLDGIAEAHPEFDEVIRYGREYREKDKPK
jgi:hypothetical protein